MALRRVGEEDPTTDRLVTLEELLLTGDPPEAALAAEIDALLEEILPGLTSEDAASAETSARLLDALIWAAPNARALRWITLRLEETLESSPDAPLPLESALRTARALGRRSPD